MDKAVIFGAFDFVNFQLCQSLLDRGMEVEGIHLEEQQEELFLEEKRLEVGRNANFKEYTPASWPGQKTEGMAKTTVILSFYDLYMVYKERVLKKEAIQKAIFDAIEQYKNLAVILPVQMAAGPGKSDATDEFRKLQEKCCLMTEQVLQIYLPTVYGPWQPPTFLFQQAILKKINGCHPFSEGRETNLDAIYIVDAADAIISILESETQGSWLLKTGRENQWQECAVHLHLDEKTSEQWRDKFQLEGTIRKVELKRVTPISESLSRQLEHAHRLYMNPYK